MRIEAHLDRIAARLCQEAETARPREACGLITAGGDVIAFPNRSAEPEHSFDIGPLAEIPASEAIWHTHPDDEPPSPADVAGCRATAIPWVIAGPMRIWVLHPRPMRLVEREFAYGIDDCWQLVTDWHAQERGILLPWFRRPLDGWWNGNGPSPFLEAAESYGFDIRPIADVGIDEIRPDDTLLMRIAARLENHTAVYLGGGNVLHHLYDHLSCIEQLDSRLQRCITHVARHKSLP